VAYKNTIAITLNNVKQISYVVIFLLLMLKPEVQVFLEEFAVLSLGFCFWWLLLEVATAPFWEFLIKLYKCVL